MDPLRHPDLLEISHLLRQRMNAVLSAEQEAAIVSFNRSRTIRDRLLEIEDQAAAVEIRTVEGSAWEGTLGSVGADHVVLRYQHGEHIIANEAIAAVTLPSD